MQRWVIWCIFPFFVFSMVVSSLMQPVVYGDVTSCNALVAQHAAQEGSVATFQFRVSNSDSTPFSWIRITRPSPDYTITNAVMSGWSSSSSDESAIFTGGIINPSENNEQIYIDAVANTASTQANWIVEVSDDPDGANPFSCSGNLDTYIYANTDSSAPNISDIVVTNISSNSATITWTTDEAATSQINYGINDTSEFSIDTQDMVTEHSLTLSGLDTETFYHYVIVSRDSYGNESVTGDSTFLTTDGSAGGTNPAPPPGNNSTSSSSPLSLLVPLKSVPTEKVLPVVTVDELSQTLFRSTPQLTGKATDNDVIAGLEYSLDAGRNWLPIKNVTGTGSGSITFNFIPENLEDGNYTVTIRAIDTSGNVSKYAVLRFVIDLIPPTVGGIILTSGPLVMESSGKGVLELFEGVNQVVTASATGGATEIVLATKKNKSDANPQIFSLTKNEDQKLWQGLLSFQKSGNYTLVAQSKDGAGNYSEKHVASIIVHPATTIRDHNAQPIKDVELGVYYQPSGNSSWQLWDADPFLQVNPQKTNANGKAKLLLPAGKYYVKLQHPDYSTSNSNVFSLTKTTPISTEFILDRKFGFSIGDLSLSIPSIHAQNVITSNPYDISEFKSSDVLGKQIPHFSLASTGGNNVTPIELLGKPTLLCFLSTWSPAMSSQLEQLEKISSNRDIGVYVVGIGENIAKLSAVKKIRADNITWIADKHGQLASQLNISHMPTNVFISRKGIIKETYSHFLDAKSLQNRLGEVDK